MPEAPVEERPSAAPDRGPLPDPPVRAPAARRTGPTRLYALDVLRLFAALAVLSFHWTADAGVPEIWGGRTPQDFMPTVAGITQYGWLGVELFFIISGFVICMSSWGRQAGDFVVSRVVRLYPAFWAAILLTATVLHFAPDLGRPGARAGIDARTVVVNFTMFEGRLGYKDVDGVYWTLWLELQFYLLFAIVVAMGLTYRRVVAFCGIWLVVAMIANGSEVPILEELAMLRQAPYFVAGVTIYLMYRFGPNLLLWAMVGFTWLLAMADVPGLKKVYDDAVGDPMSTVGVSVAITLAYAVIIAVALGWFDWVRWKGLAVFGALTYPLYLIHQEAGWTLIHWLRERGLGDRAAIGVALVAALTVAWLLHRLVERPLSRLMKRGFDKSLKTMREASDPAPRRGLRRSSGEGLDTPR
ncbi:acyltransferase [Embleya sp. NBC_00888]|uniref:acyltransferase family protein n=1 Tax=Embleya sp. NBC_00888 TaxID=2975960 RepID=UPI00386D2534|nr:acyltransferase [Embleya sp. NBC_00888]